MHGKSPKSQAVVVQSVGFTPTGGNFALEQVATFS